MKFLGCCVIIALLLLSCGNEDDREQAVKSSPSTQQLSKPNDKPTPSEPSFHQKQEPKTIISELAMPVEKISSEPRQSALPRQDLFPAAAFASLAFPDSIATKNPIPIWSDPAAREPVTSLNRYFIIDFENDIFTNTDYYFTNGASLGMIHPALQHLFLSRLLPNAGRPSLNHYGIALRQNIYTPINPEAIEIVHNDRPFAGVLFLEYFKISTQHLRQLQLKSFVQIGVIGPPSMASWIQKKIHELNPSGWRYQINSDLLINYSIEATQRILRLPHLDWRVQAAARLGSYRTEVEAGTAFRFGMLPIAFNPFPIAKAGTIEFHPQTNKWLGWFEIEAKGRYTVHDASLRGGLFNRNSPYMISSEQFKNATIGLSAGINLAYKSTALAIKIVYLSPEFKHGYDHRWGSIQLMHNF